MFVIQVQPNNYATFYDDTRQSWSLMFDSESILVQFAKQVMIRSNLLSIKHFYVHSKACSLGVLLSWSIVYLFFDLVNNKIHQLQWQW